MKRPLDLFLALSGLIVTAPIWMIIPVAIWLEDRGPIFYKQRRVGKDGQEITILKFRTLVQNADQVVLPWMVPDRAWVTKVGGFLRQTALDELPQVLSILKGDMSFVGPRAMPMGEFRDFKDKIQGLEQRLCVRPGLTGLAQVYGKATRNARAKLRYDLLYIKPMNLWLDLRLIILSIWITLCRKWETPG
jgi:lipopolysaccharide/colanic/teichoic acid biosynthesis glycosyltransferase